VFFEGAMTAGFSSNATDAAVLADIVAAGYEKEDDPTNQEQLS